MIIACPECVAPFEVQDEHISALVQVECPGCAFRMILDFAAANDSSLVEEGMKMASGFRSPADYRAAVAPRPTPLEAVAQAPAEPVASPAAVAAEPVAAEPVAAEPVAAPDVEPPGVPEPVAVPQPEPAARTHRPPSPPIAPPASKPASKPAQAPAPSTPAALRPPRSQTIVGPMPAPPLSETVVGPAPTRPPEPEAVDTERAPQKPARSQTVIGPAPTGPVGMTIVPEADDDDDVPTQIRTIEEMDATARAEAKQADPAPPIATPRAEAKPAAKRADPGAQRVEIESQPKPKPKQATGNDGEDATTPRRRFESQLPDVAETPKTSVVGALMVLLVAGLATALVVMSMMQESTPDPRPLLEKLYRQHLQK